MYSGDSSLSATAGCRSSNLLLSLKKNENYEVICMYITLEIRHSLQTKRFVGVRISFCPSYYI